MIIKYCKKCHLAKRSKNLENVNLEFKKILGDDVIIKNICISCCGPGKKKFLIEIDEEVIEANSYEELIAKLKENYGN